MSIVLVGSTSGSVTLQEPAVAGTTVLTLPAVSGTVITTASSISRSMLGNLGGIDLVAQTTTVAASAGDLSFNNVFTSAYKSYFIVFNIKLTGAGVNDLYLRYRNSAADITSLYGYQASFYASDNSGINFTTNNGTATTYALYDNMGTGPLNGIMEMYNPGVTAELKGASWNITSWDSRPKTIIGSGVRNASATYDGCTFFTGDGNGIGAGSVFSIYGRY